MKAIFQTEDSWSSLVLRLVLGVVFFAHGSQKMLGWFGGYGFAGTMAFFTQQMHIPMPLALLVFIAEFFGSLGLIIGFLSRVAAFGIACDMIGAILMVHLPNGFFMNWSGKNAGEGYEYFLLIIAICVALMLRGSGKWSVDRAIAGS
jgi:putative oxidoreductase